MTFLKNCLWIVIVATIAFGCKGKKKAVLSGDDPVEIADFIEFFQPVKLPYTVTDTLLQKKEKDSLLISQKVFSQFIPDSILTKVFGKGSKHKIYPIGKVEVSGAETYLFVKVVGTDKRSALVLSLDKKKKFLAAMELLRPDAYVSTMQSTVMDKKYVVTKTLLRKNGDGSMSEGKDVYVLNNDARNFMLIMTDALDDKITEVINPIDTLARKNKFSADYVTNKLNMVSIRDSRRSDRLSFFIHFEKSNGECTGELKGEATIKSPTLAEYSAGGDPCILKFIFTTNSVTLKEQEGCGAHRGLRCSFDGSFPRKKDIKPKPVKVKVVSKK